MAGQRTPRPAEPEGFEQDGPQDHLLIHDQFVPPGTDVDNVESRTERRDTQSRNDIQHADLDQVDRVHHLGCAEAVFGPVRAENAQPVEKRPVEKGLRFHGREIRGGESHGYSFGVKRNWWVVSGCGRVRPTRRRRAAGSGGGRMRLRGDYNSAGYNAVGVANCRRRAGLSILPTGFRGRASTMWIDSGILALVTSEPRCRVRSSSSMVWSG